MGRLKKEPFYPLTKPRSRQETPIWGMANRSAEAMVEFLDKAARPRGEYQLALPKPGQAASAVPFRTARKACTAGLATGSSAARTPAIPTE
jgi:hypothetical protein